MNANLYKFTTPKNHKKLPEVAYGILAVSAGLISASALIWIYIIARFYLHLPL